MVNFRCIPQEGACFRLRGLATGYAIYSRIENEPLVGHSPGFTDDQLFTLIRGTGPRQNLYAIKSVPNGRVLFSRRGAHPCVGNINGDGAYDDNWFQFVQDDGDPNSFRIYSPFSDTVIFSRGGPDPPFGNYIGPKYGDQLWHFEVVDIVGYE